MTIKDLGRWESLEMVHRYTRSVTFEDSLRFYKAPLGELLVHGSCCTSHAPGFTVAWTVGM
jgi:hypothetical protein